MGYDERVESLWRVYMARCSDGTLYTGVALDVRRRIRQHNGSLPGGAKYTRGRRPVRLVYEEPVPSRSEALRREATLKRLAKEEKEAMARRRRR